MSTSPSPDGLRDGLDNSKFDDGSRIEVLERLEIAGILLSFEFVLRIGALGAVSILRGALGAVSTAEFDERKECGNRKSHSKGVSSFVKIHTVTLLSNLTALRRL